jgi:hypothetical protein
LDYFCDFRKIVQCKQSPIGRKFAQSGHPGPKSGCPDWANFRPWAIFYFRQFFLKIREAAQTSGLLLFTVKVIQKFDKNGLGYNLGDIFTNTSGHPARNVDNHIFKTAERCSNPKIWTILQFSKIYPKKWPKIRQIWDRCFDFKNIFAEFFGEKLAFYTQNKAKLCKILIITLVCKKNTNFFAKNCQI